MIRPNRFANRIVLRIACATKSRPSANRERWRQTGSRQSTTPIDDTDPIRKFSIDPGSHRLAKPSRTLSKREAHTEFQYRPHIVDADTFADAVLADAVSETSRLSSYNCNQTASLFACIALLLATLWIAILGCEPQFSSMAHVLAAIPSCKTLDLLLRQSCWARRLKQCELIRSGPGKPNQRKVSS